MSSPDPHALFLLSILLIGAASAPSGAPNKLVGGIPSQYTDEISRRWTQEAASVSSTSNDAPILLECISTPNNDTYIGIHQWMAIHAPLAEVEKTIDDVANYKNLFDDLLASEVRERSANQYVVFSEQHIPIPFVANERDEVIYQKKASTPGQVHYRYQLKSSNHLKFNDGFISLKSLTNDLTAYEELDFWDASWGIAKTFGAARIWKDCVGGIAQSDLALKLKAENPSWAASRAKDESIKARDKLDLDACLKHKR